MMVHNMNIQSHIGFKCTSRVQILIWPITSVLTPCRSIIGPTQDPMVYPSSNSRFPVTKFYQQIIHVLSLVYKYMELIMPGSSPKATFMRPPDIAHIHDVVPPIHHHRLSLWPSRNLSHVYLSRQYITRYNYKGFYSLSTCPI